MNRTDRKLAEIEARLPHLACRGLCQSFCGPVMMSDAEEDRMRRAGFEPPNAEAMIRTGCLACPLLRHDGRCAAYAVRPMVCRLWGVARGMECPHGCTPSRYAGREESKRLLALVAAL